MVPETFRIHLEADSSGSRVLEFSWRGEFQPQQLRVANLELTLIRLANQALQTETNPVKLQTGDFTTLREGDEMILSLSCLLDKPDLDRPDLLDNLDCLIWRIDLVEYLQEILRVVKEHCQHLLGAQELREFWAAAPTFVAPP